MSQMFSYSVNQADHPFMSGPCIRPIAIPVTSRMSEEDEILNHLVCFIDGKCLWDSEDMAVLNSNADAVMPYVDQDTGEVLGYLG